MPNTFLDLLSNDVNEVFLKDDFSKKATYTNNISNTSFDVSIQFFKDSLDKLDSNYSHCWASYEDLNNVSKNDTFKIDNVLYSVVEAEPDELNQGVNILLNEV